ncbi:hypothetical protein [Curtobacterium sp. B8]|uniref:hypothetical protein n=1 Tax=Curtobacterium sp. B8 TaxID=95611 RepID=UPI00034A6D6E|nr:hypothetical protein [Curtobacterium sp. B8]
MTSPADWETEGATARAAVPSDALRQPIAVRVATWTGVVLLVVALVVYAFAAQVTAGADETEVQALARFVVLVVVATGVGVLGGVALLLRLVAGAFLRR